MKTLSLMLLVPLTVLGAEHDHAAATAPVTAEHDHGATQVASPTVAMPMSHTTMMEHGGMWNSLLLVDRFEQQQRDGDNVWLWDAQAWYGSDRNKLWLKTEGSWNAQKHSTKDSEIQLLYSHAVAAFWDVQAGVQHDDGDAASRSHLVLGVQGLSRYWFEMDTAALISERGDLQLRFSAEYDLRFTQKLLLQPRIELNHAFADDKAAGIEKGWVESNLGLRLRYEFVREFAPYIGVERDIGNDRQPDATRVVAGFRVWY